MTMPASQKRRQAAAGFTLVELLLATVLLLLLAGAVVFNFTTLQRGAELDEGAAQFEGLLRFARAQAANTGRPVQINFEEEIAEGMTMSLGDIRVLWEPDPLDQPGVLVELPEAAPFVRGITDLVEVQNVRAEEPSAAAVPEEAAEAGADGADWDDWWGVFPPITFYPDGSSDSAEITLASRAKDDSRRVSVRLAGVTGAIRRELVVEDSEVEPQEQEPKKARGPESPGTTESRSVSAAPSDMAVPASADSMNAE